MRFRVVLHKEVVIGFVLAASGLDVCVLIFRLIGLPRATAIYAGVLSFAVIGFVCSRTLLRRSRTSDEENQEGVNHDD